MNSRSHFLCLEDTVADLELLQETLQADGLACEITRVDTECGFLAALQQDGFDLILADYTLPSFDGLSALRLARQQKPDLPFIFVSGTMGEEVAIEALKTGATDYVLKTRLSRLAPAVRRALREARERLELRSAEEAARRSERELRDVIETIPAMAWSALADGSNAFVNSRWTEFTGLSAGQTAGSGWHAAIHPDDIQRHIDRWRTCVVTGETLEIEVRMRRADGQYRWHLCRGVPLRDERGGIVKWYGVLTDIEDRKRAEQEREQLRQLEAGLAHMNRVSMMGEMAASLAHEIKQPIAAAINSANSCITWLGHEPPNLEKARAAAAKVDEYGNRAAEIIDHIRSFYKYSPPQRELVEVNRVIHDILMLLDGEATRSSVAMRTELAAGQHVVLADRVQLQQVFMNLMLNAIEAMKDAGGELTVKSRPEQDGELLFSVSDTGPGLPSGNVDQIFSAFFTTKPKGSGLGLAISRSVVESHGGRLWATANDGRGATFHFSLPTQVTESALTT
jgi:PAS domain S-box-containing protein